ncbi:MAG TPA: hypothetical protein VER36_02015, partial [Flavisolibacter sp.]|nr:hypothetical protein [Flavisolibacter sp.]
MQLKTENLPAHPAAARVGLAAAKTTHHKHFSHASGKQPIFFNRDRIVPALLPKRLARDAT